VHLIERMKRSKKAGKIVLCTSTHPNDAVLLDVAKKEGIASFAGSELDVMKRFIDAAEQNGFKVIVRVTGDNPLTDPENIDAMIDAHLAGGYDFTKSEFLPIGMNAEVISLSTLKRAYETAEDTSLTEYMTTYLKRPDIFKVHNFKSEDPFFENRMSIRLTVDYEADLNVMQAIYSDLYPKNVNFTARDVLMFLDANLHLLEINAQVYQIPLPKIRFKGEKAYDKKLLLVGEDMQGPTAQVVKRLKEIDEYEIVGFFHDTKNIEFSLIDGIPVLGKCAQLGSVKTDAQYYVTTFTDPQKKIHYNKVLDGLGLRPVHL
jgi:spore coat polysaccharide biosynthesis protein SpsF